MAVLRGERGSATPLLALLIVLVGGLGLGLGRLGAAATSRAAAQTAADAAALAGAAEGAAAAKDLAAWHGAEVERYDDPGGGEVEVEVSYRGRRAAARARDDTPPAGPVGLGGGVPGRPGLVPELVAALDAAGRVLGRPVPITSGWRSRAEQQRLHDDRGSNPYPVARPGTSAHERGTAVDVPRWFVARLASVASQVGLCHPWPEQDPVHFELCGGPP